MVSGVLAAGPWLEVSFSRFEPWLRNAIVLNSKTFTSATFWVSRVGEYFTGIFEDLDWVAGWVAV